MSGGTMSIHPIAALFPMMADDELADLAADIKAHGLVHPIVTDATGKVLIDGRNRLAACELAGVTPRFEPMAGQDPAAFIFSTNLARRDLNKGQKGDGHGVYISGGGKGWTGEKERKGGRNFYCFREAIAAGPFYFAAFSGEGRCGSIRASPARQGVDGSPDGTRGARL